MGVTKKSRGEWVVGDLTVLDDLVVTDDVTISGDITIAGGFAVGSDGSGQDLTAYGATAGVFWRWDASADTVVRDGGSIFAKAVASGDGGITVSSDGMTANPETDTEDGYITVQVGSTSYQVPIYAA